MDYAWIANEIRQARADIRKPIPGFQPWRLCSWGDGVFIRNDARRWADKIGPEKLASFKKRHRHLIGKSPSLMDCFIHEEWLQARTASKKQKRTTP